MEDFHRRSITTSRHLAGANAFRISDCDYASPHQAIGVDHEDWEPEPQTEPSQPEWDNQSVRTVVDSNHLSPYSSAAMHRPGSTTSLSSTLGPLDSPRRLPAGDRRSDASGPDYFALRPSEANTPAGTPPESPGNYGDFLSRANKQIARDQRHVPDPFLDEPVAPNRPFNNHNRLSSVESISSIMDEKGASSPLNKAIASVNWLLWTL
jgi:alpha-1,3-glucan synthase